MIFGSVMQKLNYKDLQKCVATMDNHIRSIQEQLEYTLYNLDSSNIVELDTSVTGIQSGDGGVSISGERLLLAGKNGECVRIGTEGAAFRFEVAGKGGQNVLYLDSDGQLVITRQAKINIDCGRWGG